MGCKTNQFTDICGRVHCYNYTAPNPPTVGSSVGVTIEYKEYPHSFIRDPDAIHSYNTVSYTHLTLPTILLV